ncbi:MAG: recombinase family protein [Ruminiclostridium sp.]
MADYTIALYIRLSVEDEKTESLSIPNQRLILREKAMSLPEWNGAEILEFVDNGHTGTNFERPAVQKLLEMANLGKINCIMVKDLSRFGRNSIETGYFIEKVFPLYHIRFIAVSDNFDSAELNGDTGGVDMAFKYLINECYSRDMSIKSKSAKLARFKRGEYQSVVCPYGYQKSEDGRMKPDEETADNVRQIFQWAADGLSAGAIARKLSEMKILTPAEYKASKGKNYHDISRSNGVWCRSAVLRILEDERYTGMYVMGKKHSAEVGSYKMIRNDESEWIKIPDHHTPIISKELFEQAKAKIRKFSVDKKPREYLMKGKVFCGCCDHAMNRQNDRWYICRYGEIGTDKGCQSARISVKDLERTVFDTIRSQAQCFIDTDADIKIRAEKSALELNGYEQKLKLLQESKRELYEQYILGILDIDTYKSKKAELEIQLADMKHLCSVVADKAKTAQEDYEESIKNAEIAASIDGADSLTKALVDQLVERVYVFPNNRIEIKYATRRFM